MPPGGCRERPPVRCRRPGGRGHDFFGTDFFGTDFFGTDFFAASAGTAGSVGRPVRHRRRRGPGDRRPHLGLQRIVEAHHGRADLDQRGRGNLVERRPQVDALDQKDHADHGSHTGLDRIGPDDENTAALDSARHHRHVADHRNHGAGRCRWPHGVVQRQQLRLFEASQCRVRRARRRELLDQRTIVLSSDTARKRSERNGAPGSFPGHRSTHRDPVRSMPFPDQH
jgi:hypothetical protein